VAANGNEPESGHPAHRLLDVGCGTGLVSEAALGGGFTVTAVDPDLEMTAFTAARLGDRARVLTAALPRLPFPDGEFHATIANFVVNHVDHPRAATRELGRVTAAGRPVALTVWPPAGSTAATLFARMVRDSGATEPDRWSLPPEVDFARDVSGLCGLLTQAGLTDPEGYEFEVPWRIDPEDLWAGVAGGVAGTGSVFSAQSHATRERMRKAYDGLVPEYLDNGLLSLPGRAVLCTALAPA
jgi:SAM-dependent methyltransferase